MPNVCHKRKILFIHPTKCAGKSIEHAVFNYAAGGKSEHMRAQDYQRNFIRDYFVFSVVRNPWDRYISQVLFDKKDPNDLKFHLEGDLDPKNSNGMGLMHGRSLWSYQDHFIINNKMVVDEVLRFENLEEEWKKVAKITGVESLPRINANSSRKHYSHYYDDESKEMLKKLWSWDIETFGYEYEDRLEGDE